MDTDALLGTALSAPPCVVLMWIFAYHYYRTKCWWSLPLGIIALASLVVSSIVWIKYPYIPKDIVAFCDCLLAFATISCLVYAVVYACNRRWGISLFMLLLSGLAGYATCVTFAMWAFWGE